MRSIWASKLVQLEITNLCSRQCANCTRCVGHQTVPFFMDIETVEKSIASLAGFKGEVGLMGGEPTLHPKFREICEIFREEIPRRRRGLWTNGTKWEEYKDVIERTFDKDLIVYNEHSTDGGVHQPLLVAMKDVVPDKRFREELKDNCWIQRRWETCSITPYGVYFCEVAGALDILFNGGKNAIPLIVDDGKDTIPKPVWWKHTELFKNQYKICDFCGAPLPIGGMSDRATFDLISSGNLKRLKKLGSPKVQMGNYAIYNKKWDRDLVINGIKDWQPWNWRNFYAYGPEDYHRNNKT